jgi:fatty-acyl-CoA synthase
MEFNLGQVFAAVAAAVPDRDCVVQGRLRRSYGEVADRSTRLANFLLGQGLSIRAERGDLTGHQSGQPHLGCYLHNGPEYLEAMVGSYAARIAPFNVNYRYVAEELRYLLNDAGAQAVVYHAEFAPTLAEVLDDLDTRPVLLQVADASDHPLLPGAVDYEAALAASSPETPAIEASPDDLYILYTGGTTGMPKGVLWRQADIFVAALGGRDLATGDEWPTIDTIVDAARNGGARALPAPPFMHGAAHWLAFNAFAGGNTVVLPTSTHHLDPADLWRTVEREGVSILLIVGDAFGRPLSDELDRQAYDLESLMVLVNGGAALTAQLKNRLLEQIPNMMLMDGLGASETGSQARALSTHDADATTGTFQPGPGMAVLTEDLAAPVEPGHEEMGWLAQEGRVPLGYLNDADKSAGTFVEVGGRRYAIPGDRARLLADGTMELHGRDSATINSGGEKIFAEEVEQAIMPHPAVYDVVVCGRPSERWGSEVVAVVQLYPDATAGPDELLAEAAHHIARYKLPKQIVFSDHIVRSPAGKADYRWARDMATRS